MQLRMKLDNLKEAMNTNLHITYKVTARAFMHISGVNKTYETMLDH